MRYLEFTDKWISSVIFNEFIFLTNNSLSREELNYCSGCRKNIHYGDILTKYLTVKNVEDSDVPFINDKVRNSCNAIKLQTGDIVIADTAEDYTTGKAIEIININSLEVYSGLHTIPLRPNKVFARGYLAYYFNSQAFKKRIFPLIQGIKVYSISKTALSSTNIKFPEIAEQKKIANLLVNIDNRINTQRKIIEDLITYKKIISTKLLYGKEYDYIPLRKYGSLKNGYAFKSDNYQNSGDYRIITISNVTGDRYVNVESCNKIINIPYDLQEHQRLNRNDILISLTGNVGRVSICNTDNCLLNQRVGVLSLNETKYFEFIYQCISNIKFEKQMISKGQGAAQLNIGKDDIESFQIPELSNHKMEKICNILSNIDKKIVIEGKILNDYIKEKYFFLSKLFI